MREWLDHLANRSVVLFIGAIVLTVTFVSLFHVAASRQELEQQARSQVDIVADMVAGELDRKLHVRLQALTQAAGTMTMDSGAFRLFSEMLIEREAPLHPLFEQLYLFSDTGDILAVYPPVEALEVSNVSDRPYFRETVGRLTPIISEPFISYNQKLPLVVMTAPVFDHDQGLAGVFAASIVLNSDNFLSEAVNTRIGTAGYLTVATREGQVLARSGWQGGFRDITDNEAHRAAVDGFEGVRITTNPDGEPVIVAIEQMNMAPWFISATWPLEDAYAPAYRLRDDLLFTIAIVLVLLVPLAYLAVKRYLNPLTDLTEQICGSRHGVRVGPVDADGYYEIRELAQAYNHVISNRIEIEAKLRAEQRRSDNIFAVLQEGLIMTDPRGVIRFANQAAEYFLNRSEDLVGQPLFQLVRLESEGQEWEPWHFLQGDEIHGLYAVLENGRGESFDVELTMLHVSKDEPDERLVFVLRDDRERRRNEEKLSWQATHDSLTGLLNRRAFTAELVKWLGEAENLQTPSVVIMIDLDHFKPVNDEGGHLLGDKLLRELASVLRCRVRESDLVARPGGDEFALLLPACGLARATELAEEIRAGIEALRVIGEGREYRVTASIGLSELSPADTGPEEVLARADEGAYAAKDQGRNRVVVIPASLS